MACRRFCVWLNKSVDDWESERMSSGAYVRSVCVCMYLCMLKGVWNCCESYRTLVYDSKKPLLVFCGQTCPSAPSRWPCYGLSDWPREERNPPGPSPYCPSKAGPHGDELKHLTCQREALRGVQGREAPERFSVTERGILRDPQTKTCSTQRPAHHTHTHAHVHPHKRTHTFTHTHSARNKTHPNPSIHTPNLAFSLLHWAHTHTHASSQTFPHPLHLCLLTHPTNTLGDTCLKMHTCFL